MGGNFLNLVSEMKSLHTHRQGKKITEIEKQELKMSLFEGDMIVYVENAKEYSDH